MKKTFSIFGVLLFLAVSVNSYSQVSTYSFSQASGSYTPITGGTVVASATGTTGAISLDDVNYSAQTIPFSFDFNGTGYTTYNINSNGYITFGATLPPTGTPYTPISSTVLYSGAIAGIGRDIQGVYATTGNRTAASNVLTSVAAFKGVVVGRIITGTGIPAGTTITAFDPSLQTITMSAAATTTGAAFTISIAAGEIRSETIGSSPNQIHVIQYTNFRKFGGLVDCFQLQIRLRQSSNIIEIVYRIDTSNATNGVPQVGLRGASNADFNNRTTTTDWTASTAGGTNTATMALTTTVKPPNGHTYIWTPFAALANDVGTTAITNPNAGSTPGSLTPQATIKNFGTNNQLTPFNITCTINPGGYSNTISDTLSAGLSRSKSFANFTFNGGIDYTITVYTSLASDQNRNNDTQRVVLRLTEPNFGSDSGYFWANNLATTRPSFPLYCWKDTSGSKSIMSNGVTQAGNTLVGNLDDGYYVKSLKSILLELNQDTTNRHIKYMGNCYDSIFPGTNGIIGFTQQFGAISLASFNIDAARVANYALLPIWHDGDFADVSGGRNRLSYKVKNDQLIITYDRIVSFEPATDWVSYQVVIELVTGCGSPNSNFRYSYADTVGQKTSSSYVTNYLAQYGTATSSSITIFRNYVVGHTGTGAVIAHSGLVSSGNPFPATPQTTMVLFKPIFNLTTRAGLAIEYGSNVNILNVHDCVALTVRLTLEGLQSNAGPRSRDTVDVEIRDASVAPYKLMQKARIYLDSTVNQKGIRTLEFSILKRNNPYYIVINHRNSIRSWSTIISPTGSTLTYDFTGAQASTFGGNSVLTNGNWSFYSGDVNQDGIVDGSDASAIDNDAFNFVSGDYVITDLNWDGIVDGSDAAIVDNNAFNFVGEIKPPGALRPSMELPVDIKYEYTPSTEVIILPDPYAQPKIETTK